MIFLEIDFTVIKPEFGLLFWTTLLFAIFFFLMKKFAFAPIVSALKEREDSIDTALQSAEKARAEMQNLTAQNEQILRQAQEEKAVILKEAKDMKEQIIREAKEQATAEFRAKVESAAVEIRNRELEMLTNVKNQVGSLSIEIAEKLMRERLKGDAASEAFVGKLVSDIKLN
jgi:F-type H+-transporting ATPase subunit b